MEVIISCLPGSCNLQTRELQHTDQLGNLNPEDYNLLTREIKVADLCCSLLDIELQCNVLIPSVIPVITCGFCGAMQTFIGYSVSHQCNKYVIRLLQIRKSVYSKCISLVSLQCDIYNAKIWREKILVCLFVLICEIKHGRVCNQQGYPVSFPDKRYIIAYSNTL